MNADDLQNLYNNLRGNRAAFPVLDAHGLFIERKMGEAYQKLLHAHDVYQQTRSRLLRLPPERQVDAKATSADLQIKRIERKQQKALDMLEKFEQLLAQLEALAEREKERNAAKAPNDDSADDPMPPSDSSTREAAEETGVVLEDSGDVLEDTNVAEEDTSQEGNPRRSDPAQSDTAQSDTAQSDTAQSDTAQSDTAQSDADVARSSDVSGVFAEAFRSSNNDDQLSLISHWFGFRAVQSEEDIYPDALYLIRTREGNFLVFTRDAEKIVDKVRLKNAVSDQPVNSFSRKSFVSLGIKRKMVLLTKSEFAPSSIRDESTDTTITEEGKTTVEERQPAVQGIEQGEGDSEDQADGEAIAQNVLDMGAFSQLMDSAQRSGIVPGADKIAYVRDREFRMGKFDQALQAIEAMNAAFTANSNRRDQQLSREDADIASGRIKISPKQLQAKRVRDRMQTQAIERARNRFQRVLDGLRILLRTS